MNGNDMVKGWSRLSDEAEARKNLATAAAFITGFELLRQAIVGGARDSYVMPGRIGGQAEYEDEVLRKYGGVASNSGRQLKASLGWLRENGALGEDDVKDIERLAGFRNELAHDLFEFLLHGSRGTCVQHIARTVALLGELEAWTGRRNFIPVWPVGAGAADTNMDEVEIPTIQANILKWLAQVALNSAELSDTELRELTKELRCGPK